MIRYLPDCRWILGVAPVLILIVAGCGRDDGIRQYTVEKLPPREAAPAGKASTSPTAQPLSSNAGWFFKLTGPIDAVKEQQAAFTGLFAGLKFNAAGNPEYPVPAGWTKSEGPRPRFETLTLDGSDPPLEITISSLPGPGTDVPGYIQANLNRWRQQLGLPEQTGREGLEAAARRGELSMLPLGVGLAALMNLDGETKEFGESRMIAAVILPGVAAPQRNAAREEKSSPLEFKTPEGWQESAGNSLRLASFDVPHDSGKADVSVTRLGGGGGVLENVNRWRGQVKLDPIDEATLAESLETLQIDGRETQYVAALGEESSILAAIVTDGDSKWFFKMQGPTPAVEAEQARFREFLDSVSFKE